MALAGVTAGTIASAAACVAGVKSWIANLLMCLSWASICLPWPSRPFRLALALWCSSLFVAILEMDRHLIAIKSRPESRGYSYLSEMRIMAECLTRQSAQLDQQSTRSTRGCLDMRTAGSRASAPAATHGAVEVWYRGSRGCRSDWSRTILGFSSTMSVKTSAWRRNSSAVNAGWVEIVETTVTRTPRR